MGFLVAQKTVRVSPLAEREGFEPSDGFIHHTISNRAP